PFRRPPSPSPLPYRRQNPLENRIARGGQDCSPASSVEPHARGRLVLRGTPGTAGRSRAMTAILTLRLTRRVLAAAAIKNGEMALLDGRFLNSRTDRTVPAAMRYLIKLLEQVDPTVVVLDAPGSDGSHLTGEIRGELTRLLATRRIPLHILE